MSARKKIQSARRIDKDIARVVVPRERISRRVRELARRIAAHYRAGDVTILAVLTGSFIFLADLIRRLPMPARMHVLHVSSYPGKRTRTSGPRFDSPIPDGLTGRHVLIVDDILDSGKTLRAVMDAVEARKPASLRTCVLLRKDRPGLTRPVADFVGFDVEDEFLVGYGLDFDGLYRNLPDLCVLKEHHRPKRRLLRSDRGRQA